MTCKNCGIGTPQLILRCPHCNDEQQVDEGQTIREAIEAVRANYCACEDNHKCPTCETLDNVLEEMDG